MKNVDVKVVDMNTLELVEDASKGDRIVLSEINKIDESFINNLIDSKQNSIFKEKYEAEKENALKAYEINKNKEIQNIKENSIRKINDLQSNVKELTIRLESNKKTIELETENKYKDKINELENKVKELSNTIESDKEKMKLVLTNELNSLKTKLTNEKEIVVNKLNDEKIKLEKQLEQLKFTKSLLNVKQLGEELEKWCNQEYEEASLTGFENCTWFKDNEIKKSENEEKGTKADYIFKIYSSDVYAEENLLSSVCLEMKNESINSTNKKKNSDYYKRLDENRNKKGCEYALLVSELEMDSSNDCPIKKVNEYKNMYVVRPPYMISFLGLIYSLSIKQKDLINQINREKISFEESSKILEQFEQFKITYFYKPLNSLKGKVDKLNENNDKIINAAAANQKLVNDILYDELQKIQEKMERFDIKKIAKDIDKINK